jgi:hypothetical protein
MHGQSIKDEAKACRALAKRYSGRAEEPFLLKLASTFEELAFVKTASPSRVSSATDEKQSE